jgi:hypothetical protein
VREFVECGEHGKVELAEAVVNPMRSLLQLFVLAVKWCQERGWLDVGGSCTGKRNCVERGDT